VIEVTDEDDVPAVAEDLWNYNLGEEDVLISSPESSVMANNRNYNSELEPVPPFVPPEQQASSSRDMLDDLPPPDTCFLSFRVRSIEELMLASCSSFVKEIAQQAMEDGVDMECLENALLLMSGVFSQAGSFLGQKRHNGKGKGKERAQ
jgi:hypothetical protein